MSDLDEQTKQVAQTLQDLSLSDWNGPLTTKSPNNGFTFGM